VKRYRKAVEKEDVHAQCMGLMHRMETAERVLNTLSAKIGEKDYFCCLFHLSLNNNVMHEDDQAIDYPHNGGNSGKSRAESCSRDRLSHTFPPPLVLPIRAELTSAIVLMHRID
jgi:hypothetical protein